jgi:hypothetical protein
MRSSIRLLRSRRSIRRPGRRHVGERLNDQPQKAGGGTSGTPLPHFFRICNQQLGVAISNERAPDSQPSVLKQLYDPDPDRIEQQYRSACWPRYRC